MDAVSFTGDEWLSETARPLANLQKELELIAREMKFQIDSLDSGRGKYNHYAGLRHASNTRTDQAHVPKVVVHSPLQMEDVGGESDEDVYREGGGRKVGLGIPNAHVHREGWQKQQVRSDKGEAHNQKLRRMDEQEHGLLPGQVEREYPRPALSPREKQNAIRHFLSEDTVDDELANQTPSGKNRIREERRAKKAFAEPGELKEEVKRALMKPTYKVTDYYHTSGLPQKICRSTYFENISLSVISLNGIWIGIDADYNKAEVPIEADPVFIIVDQLFCVFFSVELFLRFLSFKCKRNVLKDRWFVFDFVLVTTMIFETWIMNLVLLLVQDAGGGFSAILKQTTVLRLLRLLRLLRMARMAKLLRSMPEIMVVINGMIAAVRTVLLTLTLMVCLIYVFAITFNALLIDSDVALEYFRTIPESMHTLVICGVFPDLNDIMRAIADEGIAYWLVFIVYALLATVTIMNMMIGVLVEVVKTTADVEREGLDIAYLKDTWMEVLENDLGFTTIGDATLVTLTRKNVWELMNNHISSRALNEVGVDVLAFVDFIGFMFDEIEEVSFPSLMEVALQFRSRNAATVKDLVDLRRYLTHALANMFPEAKAAQKSSMTISKSLLVSENISRRFKEAG